jgi:hypothetical protein
MFSYSPAKSLLCSAISAIRQQVDQIGELNERIEVDIEISSILSYSPHRFADDILLL